MAERAKELFLANLCAKLLIFPMLNEPSVHLGINSHLASAPIMDGHMGGKWH